MFNDLFPVDWNAFHFLRPVFLWLFIPLFLILILGLLSMRKEIRWKKIIAPHLRKYVIRKGSERIKIWINIVLFFSIGMGILALSGPTWKKVQLPGQELETPLVILLDLSQSMMAEDLQPNRLERAKFKIHDLLKHNPRARVALIGFAGTAHTIIPLSRDYEIILSHLDGLKPSIMPFPGSDLESAMVLADSVMNVTDAPGTILIVSDDLDDSQFSLIQKLSENGNDRIEILPMNTVTGSEVLAVNNAVMKDQNGNPVYSSLNESVLSKMASLERVTVHRLTLDDSDVEQISKTVNANLKFLDQPTEKKDDWLDAGLLLVIPMAFLLLIWFRKGWVLYGLIIVLCSSCNDSRQFIDLWYTKDYQGQRLSNNGDFKMAAEKYQDPMHKGVAYFKAGEYEQAIKAFNEDTTAMGAYNLGLAYFENGDTLAAKLAFDQAVEMDPNLGPARENQQKLEYLSAGKSEMDPKDAQEAGPQGSAKNEQNKSMEDLSGGGQEATKEDMEKERLEETVTTDIRKGKELEEVPDDIGSTIQQDNSKVLMRKVDDDPSLFLEKKFVYQVKKYNIKPKDNETKW